MVEKSNHNDLISQLEGFVGRLEMQNWNDIPNANVFVDLHKEILIALKRTPIVYKVCNIDTTSEKHSGFIEYDTKYFRSLSAAKKELFERFHRLSRSPFVASPDEILDSGLTVGIRPQNCKSIITNGDLDALPPHARFKFYELRMTTGEGIVPIQLLLTQINIAEAAIPCSKQADRNSKLIMFPGNLNNKG